MLLVPRWSLAIFLLPHPPDLWWWSIYPSSPTRLFPFLSFPLCPFTFNSLLLQWCSSPPSFDHVSLFPSLACLITFHRSALLCTVAPRSPHYAHTQGCPEGLSEARRLRSQLRPGSKRPRHKSETWGSPGDFWPQDSIQSFTVVSVGLYEAAFCKLRAIYTLVIISIEIFHKKNIKGKDNFNTSY